MSDKLKQLKKRVKELQKQIENETQTLFKEACIDLFKDNPKLESFSFTAFTPYFADGDECVYSLNSDYPDINGQDGYDIDEKTDLSGLQEKVQEILRCIDDNTAKAMFGDHVKITVTPNKITTKEYSHD